MKRLVATIGAVAGLSIPFGDSWGVCLDERGVSGYHIPLAKEIQAAHTVAIGTVVSKVDVTSGGFVEATVYRFAVEETLRGKHHTQIELSSENTSGRFPMDIGSRYLAFVSKDRGTFYVSNCGSSGKLPEYSQTVEAVRKKLRKGANG